jgi:hypothetical protein
MHSQCRLWVISGQTIAGGNPILSALPPRADIRSCIGPTGSIDLTLDDRSGSFTTVAQRLRYVRSASIAVGYHASCGSPGRLGRCYFASLFAVNFLWRAAFFAILAFLVLFFGPKAMIALMNLFKRSSGLRMVYDLRVCVALTWTDNPGSTGDATSLRLLRH